MRQNLRPRQACAVTTYSECDCSYINNRESVTPTVSVGCSGVSLRGRDLEHVVLYGPLLAARVDHQGRTAGLECALAATAHIPQLHLPVAVPANNEPA